MARCAHCGEQTSFPYTCNYCDRDHCSEHRLPEKHRCSGLYDFSEKHLEGGGPDTSDARQTGRVQKKSKPKPSTNYGAVGTTPDLEWDSSPDTELKAGAGGEDSSSPPLWTWLIMPFVLLYYLVVLILNRPVGSFLVGSLLIGGLAMGVAGPVDLGEHFGDRGESIDRAVTDGVDGVVAALTRNTSEERAEPGRTAPVSGADTVPSATATPTRSEFHRLVDAPRPRVVELVHAEINERRQEHGLDPLNYDPELGEIAQDYSEAMLGRDTLSHTEPNGDDFSDRYEESGYLCDVEINESWTTGGAENILYTYQKTELTGDRYYDTPEELAEGVVNLWMNSPGHRENLLKPYWHNEGLGIAAGWVDGHIKVYVTQNFC